LDETSDDFDYETRALCFDKNMSSSSGKKRGEIDIRENYIVESCWGGSYNSSDFNTVEDLTDFRDGICTDTEGLADRFFFTIADTANPTLCREAVDCIEDKTDGILDDLKDSGFMDAGDIDSALQDQDTSEIYGDTGVVTFAICFEKSESEISETLENCESSVSSTCSTPEFDFDGHPACGVDGMEGSLPTCPFELAPQFQDFGPGYPEYTEGMFGYSAATATLRPLFIPCEADRTSADAVGVILFLKPIFVAIQIALEALRDSFPQDWIYTIFVFTALIPAVIVLALEIVLEQADFHDALIQGAEIEALFENTRQMLNASAAIYDEVVCRCIDDLESRPQSKFMSFSCAS
jgi:hypothetical protein